MITIGKTKSVCPECMKVVPAIKGIGEDGIYLVKECNAHGKFQTLIWEGNAADYLSWGRENLSAETPVNPKVKEKSCPDNCGLCEEHERKGCCMILEVTKRCNMHCPVCFASAGEDREKGDIPICEIEKQYDFLHKVPRGERRHPQAVPPRPLRRGACADRRVAVLGQAGVSPRSLARELP